VVMVRFLRPLLRYEKNYFVPDMSPAQSKQYWKKYTPLFALEAFKFSCYIAIPICMVSAFVWDEDRLQRLMGYYNYIPEDSPAVKAAKAAMPPLPSSESEIHEYLRARRAERKAMLKEDAK